MKIFFDTEFIEDGVTIDLLSIGLVKENGDSIYMESSEADHSKASQWVKENVLPQLGKQKREFTRPEIRSEILKFVGAEKPEFWAYYADYDWVAFCQLFGTMMDLPKGWPMYCRDIKQLCDSMGNPRLPKQKEGHHNALQDAAWNLHAYQFLTGAKNEK